jgi:hypothetical protein
LTKSLKRYASRFLQNLVELLFRSAKFISLIISWLLQAYDESGDSPLDANLQFDVCWGSLCAVYENATAGITNSDVSTVILLYESYTGSGPS